MSIEICIDGNSCDTQQDFWEKYISQIPAESARYFGKNMDAFCDAIKGGGPGFPGECSFKIKGVNKLCNIFGDLLFNILIQTLNEANYIEVTMEE